VRADESLKLTDAEIQRAFADSRWADSFPPILTVDQVAELLSVPRATVYDWSSRGLLSACSRRVGKHLRFFRNRLLQQVFNKGLLNSDDTE
jgi:excisionase family DNA binding protein